MPPIVVRMLIFIYEEQEGCVKLVGQRSATFRLTNGTRQGSVLSPPLFSVYLDDLLVELRDQGVGCHIGGVWVGGAGYADDIILMAPSRTAMALMLEKCEKYAEDHNLIFSTDPNPRKSKTKCVFMTGTMKNVTYPVNLRLYNQDLPWVETATHLGHELHQLCDMSYDCKTKRGQFIGTSTDIRETFSFAHPDQVLNAVNIYASHFYGAMLWDFTSDICGQFYRSWNTCVKLAWDIPRSTHTYLVDNLFGLNQVSHKNQMLSRYVNFHKSLLKSISREVQVVANIVSRDIRSTTGKNLAFIEMESKLDPWKASAAQVRSSLPKSEVPPQEQWRLPLLKQYIDHRQELKTQCEDTKEISKLMDGLCNT